jgi:hypothetical protein
LSLKREGLGLYGGWVADKAVHMVAVPGFAALDERRAQSGFIDS